MRKAVFVVLAGVALVGCGSDATGGGGGSGGSGAGGDGGQLLQVVGSCDKNKIGVGCACTTQYVLADAVEMLRPSFESGCVAEGGTVVEVCSQELRLGTCTVTSEIAMVVTTQYANPNDSCDDDPVGNQAICESSQGTWE